LRNSFYLPIVSDNRKREKFPFFRGSYPGQYESSGGKLSLIPVRHSNSKMFFESFRGLCVDGDDLAGI